MRAELRCQALGVVFLLLLAATGWLAVAVYAKAFSGDPEVTLRVDRLGTQLRPTSDVKVRGVVVGQVKDVRAEGDGVAATLSLHRAALDKLPSGLTARLLPKSLFGQRYVSLVVPPGASGRLTEGDTIRQDRSAAAVELEKALRDLMPVLQAVQPQKLASTLGAVAEALDGQGKPLGDTLVRLNSYLDELDPTMPTLKADISKFADTVAIYQDAAPDIVDALADIGTTARTVSERQDDLASLLSTVTATAGDAESFLTANRSTIVDLARTSRPTLELLSRYSSGFPCLFASAVRLKPLMDKALGVGTDQPGLHVELVVKEPRKSGTALPAPGPRCYDTPGARPASLPNSPAENRFIAELVAGTTGEPVGAMPEWGSLLLGPVLRGTEVTLR